MTRDAGRFRRALLASVLLHAMGVGLYVALPAPPPPEPIRLYTVRIVEVPASADAPGSFATPADPRSTSPRDPPSAEGASWSVQAAPLPEPDGAELSATELQVTELQATGLQVTELQVTELQVTVAPGAEPPAVERIPAALADAAAAPLPPAPQPAAPNAGRPSADPAAQVATAGPARPAAVVAPAPGSRLAPRLGAGGVEAPLAAPGAGLPAAPPPGRVAGPPAGAAARAVGGVRGEARLVTSQLLDPGFRLLAPVQPRFPEAARRLGRAGTVRLELEVAPDGGVIALRADADAPGWGFAAAVREAFAEARFTPPTVAGEPVRVRWRRTLHFRP